MIKRRQDMPHLIITLLNKEKGLIDKWRRLEMSLIYWPVKNYMIWYVKESHKQFMIKRRQDMPHLIITLLNKEKGLINNWILKED